MNPVQIWGRLCRAALFATLLPACGAGDAAPEAPPAQPPMQSEAPLPAGEPPAPSAPLAHEPAPSVVAADVPTAPPKAETRAQRQERLLAIDRLPRPAPAALSEAPRPTKLKPGLYRCSVGEGYKLRDCLVEKDADGRTLLEIGEGNLIAARGVVWDEGRGLHFEGWLTDARPFGCFGCQDRCYVDPDSCGCKPPPFEVAEACVVQQVSMDLKGAGNQFRGELLYHQFWATYEGQGGERNLVVASREERHPVRLIFSRPCSKQDGNCKSKPPRPARGVDWGARD